MNATLMKHQKNGVNFAIKNNGKAAFYYDPGTGKTLTALATYAALKEIEPDLKLLVICPISLIHGAWVKEIEKFTDFNWMDCHSGNGKHIDGKGGDHIYLMNYEYLISEKKFNTVKEVISAKFLGNTVPWMCVIDESSKMKNHQGVITGRLIGDYDKKKYVSGIKDLCKYRLLLSGTPAPNIEWEYWPQMKFLSDDILGPNFYKFRNQYFNLQRGREIVHGAVYNKSALREMFNNGYKYEFDESKRAEFFNRLQPWCHMVKARDCLDLPEQVDEYRVFDMEGEQARVYKEMKTEYIAEIKKEGQGINNLRTIIHGEEWEKSPIENYIVVANIILTKMMKLRQISSGFFIDTEGVSRAISTKIPEKLKIILEIIDEIGNEQLIIWCQFKWEIALIVNELKKIAGVSQLHGGIDEDDRIDDIDKFINGSNRFLVANSKSAAHGLTFVNCRFAAYFSLNYSFEEYEQSRKRIHRYGQKNNCVYYHIIARNSVDEEVLAICQNKATKQEVAERFLKA